MLLATIISGFFSIIFLMLGIVSADETYYFYETVPGLFFFISFIVFICFLGAIPFTRWADTDTIKRIEACEETIKQQRSEPMGSFGDNAITESIIGTNEEIADLQNCSTFWRDKFWSHPDIMKLKPLT